MVKNTPEQQSFQPQYGDKPPENGSILGWWGFFLAPHKWTLTGFFCIHMFRKTFFRSQPFFLGLLVSLFETGRAQEDPSILWLYIGIYSALSIVIMLLILIMPIQHHIFDRVSKSMSLFGLKHYLSLSESWHENRSSGEKLQRILSARHFSYDFMETVTWHVLDLPATIIAIVLMLSVLDAPAYMIVLFYLYAGVYIWASYLTGNWLKKHYESFNQTLEQVIGKSYEFLTSTATVRLFNLRPHILKKAAIHEQVNYEARRKLDIQRFVRWTVLMGVALLFLIPIIILASMELLNGTITLAAFSAIVFMAINVWYDTEIFAVLYADLIRQWEGVRRLTEILNLKPKIENKPDAVDLAKQPEALVFDKVSFHYNENKTVIDDVNLSLTPGEKIGLIGESGAGKSTIVKLLMRFYDVQDGRITIGGKDLRDVTLGSLHDYIAVIPQDVVLFNHSIMENIRYGNIAASDEDVIAAARKAHADDFIRDLLEGYETQVGERGLKLSGGQKQRIAIARAILKDAPVLVLDEATSALDSESEKLIQQSLEELMQGKTVIAIAHRLSTVQAMDRLIVMDQGRIIEEGTHDALLKKDGRYASLWALQSGGFLGG